MWRHAKQRSKASDINSLNLRLLFLFTILFNSFGCAPATRFVGNAVGTTVGAAGQIAGGTVQTAASVLPVAAGLLPTKLIFGCIPEGTLIDTPDGPLPIELISPGASVIGFEGHPVRVLQKHGYAEDSTAKRFLRIAFENGGIVQLCDMHRLDGIRAKDLSPGYRVADQIVESIQFFDGVERSYDLLTEDAGYRISGFPVNSMIEEMIAASNDPLPARQ